MRGLTRGPRGSRRATSSFNDANCSTPCVSVSPSAVSASSPTPCFASYVSLAAAISSTSRSTSSQFLSRQPRFLVAKTQEDITSVEDRVWIHFGRSPPFDSMLRQQYLLFRFPKQMTEPKNASGILSRQYCGRLPIGRIDKNFELWVVLLRIVFHLVRLHSVARSCHL